MRIVYIVLSAIFLFSCSEEESSQKELFSLKDNASIGVDFQNNLDYSQDFNVYKYRNFYNGGGVSIGDINNDGLQDVYIVSNQKKNHLYLNQGDFSFENITESAGVGGDRAWSTGVTMVDINNDGYLDIYLCNSGDVKGDNKENELFINNGDLTFTESAAEYNLNDKGFSTHASFFDYDKDGDLDVYILNNSFQAIGSFNLRKNERPNRDELGGDKLMRNDDGVYVDVSEEAGIHGSVIGFGLGITVGDVNGDQWEDIFISNDFFERDYLYINQQDGTFSEELEDQMQSISGASMGADIGDIDNDGKNEIFVTEMLPSEYERLKTVTTFENWDRYQYGVKNGYHHQFTRNVLHYNNGDNTFSEISRFAGVEASDWSWGALFFDMDNDGLRDLFIANGIYKDLTNQDYLQYIANESVMSSIIQNNSVNYKELIDIIPSNKVANHAYHNEGQLRFEDFTGSGLQTVGFSNGAAYGDLDNDGDLDLVVNNVNMDCFFYENHTDTKNNYIKLDLKGTEKNPQAIGAMITVSDEKNSWYIEHQPTRGFQSSMDPRPNVGVGTAEKIDINIVWPNGKVSTLSDVATNKTITADISTAVSSPKQDAVKNPSFTFKELNDFDFKHNENRYVDFNREALNYHMMSTRGPCVSMADLNGDGKDDFIIPGSKGNETQIISNNGKFISSSIFETIKNAEHIKCDIFDADGDGDKDIYLASGGVELTKYSDMLYDELLLNDGNGKFESSSQKLPSQEAKISTGAVAHSDIDGDGDIDMVIGERVKVGDYGAKCSGYILENDGKGNMKDITATACPDLKNIGLITDAVFQDMDGDGDADLIVAGEFMEVAVFINKEGKFTKVEQNSSLLGWWNAIETVDIDNDGDLDIIAANHGTNSRFEASADHPIRMYFNDYDKNGFPEGIMTHNRADGKDYPFALRHNLTARLPALKKKYPDFESFKMASINDIFSKELLDEAQISEVNELRSVMLINDGQGKLTKQILPLEVQLSPMYAIAHYDVNSDGYQDIIMGGNLYNVQPEMGRYDASYGHVLINDGQGNFQDKAKELGLAVKGEIRDFAISDDVLYIFRNNDTTLSYKIESLE